MLTDAQRLDQGYLFFGYFAKSEAEKATFHLRSDGARVFATRIC
jgi:hypothetical protein